MKRRAPERPITRSPIRCVPVAALLLLFITSPLRSVPRADSTSAPASAPAANSTSAPSIEQFLSPAYPQELVSAKRADRIAWWAYERGQRNVYTAAAPDFRPVRLTRFTEDNGVDISDLAISDDGGVVTFVRGSQPNRRGWVADPTSDPRGGERTIWAVRTVEGAASRELGPGTTPVLSPDGRTVLFARDGQIFSYSVRSPAASSSTSASASITSPTTTVTPLIRAWGTNGSMQWSPDATRIAFVSDRVDHSFIGVYDVASRTVTFLSPGVDHDTSPTWSPDGKRIAFIRRPGTPFALQAHQGAGSIGNPDGPAYNPLNALRNIGPNVPGRSQAQTALSGRGGRGGRGGESQPEDLRPGLTSAAFRGGATLSFWVADAVTGEGHEFWHDTPGDGMSASINAIEWGDRDHVVFHAEPEEWIRYYSVRVTSESTEGTRVEPQATLTPGDGMVENVALSSDGASLFYCTNAGDIERRHIWKVPTAGGQAVQLTRGETIDTYPAALASGHSVAILNATATMPQAVAIVAATGGDAKRIFPQSLPQEFPIAAEVTPQVVLTRAPDGLQIHNQLFLPKDLKPGEKRPAIVFVHGGPIRQMLVGYHYMHFYHIAYAVNQWLATRGYIVMSVNYRSGIGYGKSFRMAPSTGGRGNAEYQDVLAGGRYLQSRPDVDAGRIGIWGLSYGGVLTSQALARDSDLFKAGVDMAGVHLWGSSLEPDSVSYESSTISAIGTWTSPVLLIHGDDDRNVQFSQTTGLVQLLRAHNVPYELIVFPDDTHETLLHKRWMIAFNRLDEFLGRYLKPTEARTTAPQSLLRR